jgi:hypothetical protein
MLYIKGKKQPTFFCMELSVTPHSNTQTLFISNIFQYDECFNKIHGRQFSEYATYVYVWKFHFHNSSIPSGINKPR